MAIGRQWRLWLIALVTVVGVAVASTVGAPRLAAVDDPAQAGLLQADFPVPRPHPMPAQLAQACAAIAPPSVFGTASEAALPLSYFDAVTAPAAGYLIWSTFPISVYAEPLAEGHEALKTRWDQAIAAVLQDWGQYLPLQQVPSPDAAIRIYPTQPPIRRTSDGGFRAQSGETRYSLYAQDTEGAPVLRQRLEVAVKPGQADRQLEASLRHELGHALGIWGHSSSPEDALYYSQVATPPAVSPGDVATLCEVYRQPTSLGWPLEPGAVLPE